MQLYEEGEASTMKTSLWRIKESQNFQQIWGNSICSNVLNGCE